VWKLPSEQGTTWLIKHAVSVVKNAGEVDTYHTTNLYRKRNLKLQLEEGYDLYLCPCRACHGGCRYTLQTIKTHLRVHKRDEMLNFSMLGGNPLGGYLQKGIYVDGDNKFVDTQNVFDERIEYKEHLDLVHDMQRQLFDAFDLGDIIRESTPHLDDDCDNEDIEAEEIFGRLEHLEELYTHASKPLYNGLNVSVISATIVLINMAVIHGVSNAYMDELLKYLTTVLLPHANLLPRLHYKTKMLIRKLGLNYHIIHACPSGCILYMKENKDLDCCPKLGCGLSRFIAGSKCIPAKVIRHFPLISRLLRMMRSKKIATLLHWHTDFPNLKKDTVIKSIVDSPAWDHIDSHVDPIFKDDPQNMRFGLALDGVNPFRHNNT
jgi:hypothetical protein